MAFGKLHPGLVGTEVALADAFFNQASLSVRVLLSHFRRCGKKESVWDVAKRNYKGKEKLEPIQELLPKIHFERKKNATKVDISTGNVDWMAMQEKAPRVEFWEVHSL